MVKATRECGIATTHAELLGALGRRTTAALLQTGVLVGVPAGGGRLHYELTPDGDDLRERMSRALGEE